MTDTSGAPAPEPRRQLVVCCDGTSNTLKGGHGDTNVLRLAQMLTTARDRGPVHPTEQLVYYDPGVGSPDGLPPTGVAGFFTEPLRQMFGLAVGSGIYDNIGEAYLFLCREYGRLAPSAAHGTKDEIYLFGFSRGAFTVRAVAGMVDMFGLLRPDQEQLLPTLLNIYFTPRNKSLAVSTLGQIRTLISGDKPELDRDVIAKEIRRSFTTAIGRDANIHFVGVWDTVQSVGIPGLRKEIQNKATMHNLRVTHVRHLLSLDEHRRQFVPRYVLGTVRPDQSLRQLWVRGVHGDVGGSGSRTVKDAAGEARSRVSVLSEETFQWMAAEAAEVGLRNVAAPDHPAPELAVKVERDVVIADQLFAKAWWTLTGMVLRETSGAPAGNSADAPYGRPELGAFEAGPADHPSVAAFTPPYPPLPSGQQARVRSPWEERLGWPRCLKAVVSTVVIVASALLLLVATGALADRSVDYPTSIVECLEATQAFLIAQVQAVQAIGQLGSPWALVSTLWQQPASPIEPQVVLGDDQVGAALLTQLGALVLVMYLLARLATCAYSRRLTWRLSTDPRPWEEGRSQWPPPKPASLRVSPLGNALPLVLIGGLGSALAFGLSLVAGWAPLVMALQVIGGALAVLQWAGLALVLVSLAFGFKRPPSRRSGAATDEPAVEAPVGQHRAHAHN